MKSFADKLKMIFIGFYFADVWQYCDAFIFERQLFFYIESANTSSHRRKVNVGSFETRKIQKAASGKLPGSKQNPPE